MMGGFWVVEATDDEEAVALATEAQAACGNVIEVRPLQGPDVARWTRRRQLPATGPT